MRVAASVIWCACCAGCCERELSERIPSIQYLGRGADESRYCQRCEPSNQTTQGSTRTASCCWHTLHHAEHSEYSNESSPANLFFVVFYSYDQESTCSDFSLSCDGKSVAQDMGSVSELADHVDVAECSGNTHYGMLFGDIQSKCVGQIHQLTCGFRSSSTRGSTGITTTHLCHKLFAQS